MSGNSPESQVQEVVHRNGGGVPGLLQLGTVVEELPRLLGDRQVVEELAGSVQEPELRRVERGPGAKADGRDQEVLLGHVRRGEGCGAA